jgi:hypothetical protein
MTLLFRSLGEAPGKHESDFSCVGLHAGSRLIASASTFPATTPRQASTSAPVLAEQWGSSIHRSPSSNFDFGVPPLLGYLENVVDTSWMIVDDILTGKITLFCNYIAAGLPNAEEAHALTLPSETAHSTSPQFTLTAPHTK